MRPTRAHATAPALVLLAALTAGCESEQDAVPLATSVPVALLMLVSLPLVWVGAHVLLRRLVRVMRSGSTHPPAALRLRWPRLTAVLAAAPVVATVAILWAVGCFYVAFGYQERTDDLFSWDETATVILIFGAFGLIVGLLSTLVASALWSGTRRGVIASRCVLVLVVALLAVTGFGAVWLPALILSFVTEAPDGAGRRSVDAFEVRRVVQPHEPPTTGWAPPGLVGVGVEPLGE